MSEPKPPGGGSKRGFASIVDPIKRAQIAASGGRASHANGTGHKFTSSEAQAAGKLGGRPKKIVPPAK